MRSTFMGLEASRKGLFVQQSALYTTGHNISNANTEGYTRQRVNMQATPGFPYPGLNSPQYPGHLGTGVEAHSIQRMRDEFTDRQYRQETNKLGYWDSTLKAINQMEDILNEPSEFGINQAFTEFWKGFQDLSIQPTDSAARKVAIARAESLAEAFNYNYTQLETIQGNLGNEIHVATKQINTVLEKISLINGQIQALEPNGYVTNDLYDARDLLIDELNEYIPITVERVPSGGMASEVAEGSVRVIFKNGNDEIALVNGVHYAQIQTNGTGGTIDGSMPAKPFENITIVDSGNTNADNQVGIMDRTQTKPNPNPDKPDIPIIVYNNANVELNYNSFEASKGKLVSLIDSYGYVQIDADGNPVQDANGQNIIKGIYPEMLQEFNKVAKEFVAVFNDAHKLGFDLEGTAAADIENFFTPIDEASDIPFAKQMTVNSEIIDNPKLIAASSRPNEEGNGRWAMELSNLQYANIRPGQTITVPGAINPITINGDLGGFTFQDFYTGLIGDLAVMGEMAITNQFNAQTQMITISNARSSMNSVSLDEEMTNMITFQQAYNANARMITVVDETLDKIINGMGRVGL